MGFPKSVAETVLVDCGRCCAICHKFCGIKIELHHIKQVADGGEDTNDNCIPLCFDCHAEVKAYNPKHPKGRQYTESELRLHRDKWYEKQHNAVGLNTSPFATSLDIAVFQEISELLSKNKVPFLFYYDYHLEFNVTTLNSLNAFIDRCYDPNFEFIDADIENLKATLLEVCKKFTYSFSSFTDYSNEKGTFVVSSNIDESNKIHRAALKVKSAFDDIIKLGRRKYQIESTI
ncbi:MAG: HNH endonuclease [Oscillospiraceae bacterium]